MRILIVLKNNLFFRHFETVVHHLCEQGHEVKVLTRMTRKSGDKADYQEQMVAGIAAYDNASFDFNIRNREDRLEVPIRALRDTLNYAIYFRAQHNSPQLVERVSDACPPRLRAFLTTRIGQRLVNSNRFLTAYRRLQGALPADSALTRHVSRERPDVVVACPFIYPESADLEYVRSAQKLGISTVAAVASWDNLSSKGAFHLLTDSVLVWNERLATEATFIHAIPRDRIATTGAATFDPYFELAPSMSREKFCTGVGIDPDRPYLLFLGSSEQVAGDETGFVRELAAAMRERAETADVGVLVRPHPLNSGAWERFQSEGITVFPCGGQLPNMPGHRADYFNTLWYASAVSGVNTSAFLEAAILDRPCLSIVSERHRAGQIERGHFQYLVEGGFLETVADFGAAVEAIAAILAGRDPRREQRARFVESFLRPAGRERPAGEVMARAIVDTAGRAASATATRGRARRQGAPSAPGRGVPRQTDDVRDRQAV
jgi:hypothetical protein